MDIVAFHCWDAAINYLRSEACLHPDDKHDESKKEDENNEYGSTGPICSQQQGKEQVSIIGVLEGCSIGDEVFSNTGAKVYEHSTGYVSLKSAKIEQDEQPVSSCLPTKSYPIHVRPFSTHTCFLVSKDRRGLPTSQARLCDRFVHIPHLDIFQNNINKSITTPTSSNDTSIKQSAPQYPLLDTESIFSITLHHYTAWAGYIERKFEGNQKFVQDVRPSRIRYLDVGKSYKKDGVDADAVDDEYEQETNLAFWKNADSVDY